jgi:FlaA1/EpsC-like NDP-sugar epimerase
LVIGAGSAGAMVINEMKNHSNLKYMPVGLIDDDIQKVGKSISGVRILGTRVKIQAAVKEKDIDEIIIAIPSLYGKSMAELIQCCKDTGCKTRTLPALYELINEEKTIKQLRDVDVEDLLGREPVVLDVCGITEYIKGKTVMVTGGGGFIGSELCRQIVKYLPNKLIILDCYENNAYELYNELSYHNTITSINVIIASITDKKLMERIFEKYKPNVVFHAAAHKHVPLMEDNPAESIKNNVFGTLNIAECAVQSGAEKFVMISSDKAVNPTNIMGASKRICEMIIQVSNMYSSTEFVAVRFGNVLGSSGSVIPLFQKQITMGRPLTVTDISVTRYFMIVKEAVQLVLQAGAYAKGGEIFVLDMGKPVRIYDLAKDLIKLSGLEPDRDVEIEIVGLRPGEKLYEELLMAEEGLKKTQHDKIYIAMPLHIDKEEFMKNLLELQVIAENGDEEELFRKIEEIVPTYKRYRKNNGELIHAERTTMFE